MIVSILQLYPRLLSSPHSLGLSLHCFLRTYGTTFDYNKHMICVADGKGIAKRPTFQPAGCYKIENGNFTTIGASLVIEDPADPSGGNNVSAGTFRMEEV